MTTVAISSSSDCKLSSTAVVASVASVLTEMCAINDAAREQHPSLAAVTRFHSIARAPISIHDYLARIRSFSACSNSCFVIALMFLDKAQRRSGLAVDSLSVHRLMVTSIMLATKVYDDRVQRNKAYAVIGGLSTAELNRLEIELLNSLGFELEINPDDFAGYEVALMRRLAGPASPSSTSTTSAVSVSSSGSSPLSPRATPPSSSVPFSPRSAATLVSPLSPRSQSSASAMASPRRAVSFSMPVTSPSGYPPLLSPRTPHTPLPIARRQSSFNHAASQSSSEATSSPDESDLSSSSRSAYPSVSDSELRSPRRALGRHQAVLVN